MKAKIIKGCLFHLTPDSRKLPSAQKLFYGTKKINCCETSRKSTIMHTEHYSFVNLFFSNSKLGVGNHLVMNNFIMFSQLRSSFNVSRNKYRFWSSNRDSFGKKSCYHYWFNNSGLVY